MTAQVLLSTYRWQPRLWMPAAVLWILFCSAAWAEPPVGKVVYDIAYGEGLITVNSQLKSRTLMMDAYYPSSATDGYEEPLPAVIYVHGGAFHRGGRRKPPYQLGATIHSSPEDWATFLAGHGFAVFVIEYRLAPEQPIPAHRPGEQGTVGDMKALVTEEDMLAFSRARLALGLEPLDYSDASLLLFFNAYMAAVVDAVKAVNYLVDNHAALGIDPERIAMGGHSAGGGITLSAGLGTDIPLKAIFPMSPPLTPFDETYLRGRSIHPPTLLTFAQYDEPALLRTAPKVVGQLKDLNVDYLMQWVPGYMHFYPYNTPTLGDDGQRRALGLRVVDWLDQYL